MAYGELYHPQIGSVAVTTSAKGIVRVQFADPRDVMSKRKTINGDLYAFLMLIQAMTELFDYLAGRFSQPFHTPIDWSGVTGFQRQVLEMVSTIPFGYTCSYGDIARLIDRPGAARAVGHALSKNPFLIFIPCHRVIGSDGQMHGFAAPGGIVTKAWLLQLEGVNPDPLT